MNDPANPPSLFQRLVGLYRPSPFSDSLKIYLSANAILRTTGIARGVLLTWLMIDATEFGLYQHGLLLINVLLPVLSLGSYEGLARYVPEFEARRQLWAFLKRTLPLWIGGGLLTCAALFVLAGPLSGVVGTRGPAGQQESLVHWVALSIFSLMLYHTVLALLRGRRMFPAVGMMELGCGLLFSAAALTVALFGAGSGVMVLGVYAASNGLSAVVFGLPALWLARQAPEQPAPPATEFGKQARFALWAGWSAFFWQLLFCFPALYLSRIYGEGLLASFRAMTIFTQLGFMVPAAISMVVSSAVMVIWERSGSEPALVKLNVATKATLALSLVGALVVAALQDLIILAFRVEYRAGGATIPLLLLYYVGAGALSLLTIRFTLLKQSRLTFVCWSSGCVLAIFFSVLLIRPQRSADALIMTAVAGVIGVLTALGVALVNLYRRRLPPDRGTLVLLAGLLLLMSSPVVNLAAALAVLLLCASGNVVFSARERTLLVDMCRQIARGTPVDRGASEISEV